MPTRKRLLILGSTGSIGTQALDVCAASSELELVGLSQWADRYVSELSGGMLRRLDVAMGLLHRPTVLFLDEPTTGLDPEARAQMWKEIERLAGEEEMTILLTTHYLEEADRLASQLAIVDAGRIVAQGSPEQLKRELLDELEDPSLDDVYLHHTGRAPRAADVQLSEVGA